MNPNNKFLGYLGLAAAATTATTLVNVGPASASYQSASASVSDNTLTIVGTDAADTISVTFSPDGTTTVVDLGDGTGPQTFARRTFSAVDVSLRAGDDRFSTLSGGSQLPDAPVTVYGGEGSDSLLGGSGDDTLVGGEGDDDLRGGGGTDALFGDQGGDVVDGGAGNDKQFLGTGEDTAVWLPGEGSDLVDGGPGKDTLDFVGSNLAEVMSLSANGGDAVFTRNLGSIRMDLSGVEALDLATLGGADNVTVNDLSGTDVREANVDLSASGGAADGQQDTVVVKGTDGADKVDVSAHAGVVDVKGLPARTAIRGSDQFDALGIDTPGGDDRVVVDPDVGALITVAR